MPAVGAVSLCIELAITPGRHVLQAAAPRHTSLTLQASTWERCESPIDGTPRSPDLQSDSPYSSYSSSALQTMAAFWAVQVAQQELQADEEASHVQGHDAAADQDGAAGTAADGGVQSAAVANAAICLRARPQLQSV